MQTKMACVMVSGTPRMPLLMDTTDLFRLSPSKNNRISSCSAGSALVDISLKLKLLSRISAG